MHALIQATTLPGGPVAERAESTRLWTLSSYPEGARPPRIPTRLLVRMKNSSNSRVKSFQAGMSGSRAEVLCPRNICILGVVFLKQWLYGQMSLAIIARQKPSRACRSPSENQRSPQASHPLSPSSGRRSVRNNSFDRITLRRFVVSGTTCKRPNATDKFPALVLGQRNRNKCEPRGEKSGSFVG
jgi:hypothetical protein